MLNFVVIAVKIKNTSVDLSVSVAEFEVIAINFGDIGNEFGFNFV